MSGMTFPHPLSDLILPRIDPWEVDGLVQIQAAVTPGFVAVATFALGTPYRGFLTGFGYDVQDPTFDFSGSLQFQVTVNGQLRGGLAPWILQHGSPQSPAETLIYLQPGDVVMLSAKRAVAAATVHTITATLKGHQWPAIYCLPFKSDEALAVGRSGTLQAGR